MSENPDVGQMIIKCACTSLLMLIATTAFTQKYHTPAQILKIMEDSKLNYEVSPLEDNDVRGPDVRSCPRRFGSRVLVQEGDRSE